MQGSQFAVQASSDAASQTDKTKLLPRLRLIKMPQKAVMLACLLACLSLFASCELPMGKIVSLKEPPLVPSPPDSPMQIETPQETTHVANYADTADIQKFSPALAQAVTKALSLNVLKPATPESRFEPEKPILYGEFRQWANDYQYAINNPSTLNTAKPPAMNQPSSAAGPMSPPPVLTAVTQTWLPSEMMWGPRGVREQTTLNRETICALAVFLNAQDATARKMTQAQILKAQPGQGEGNPDDTDSLDGSLAQLSDISKISPWALKYVALSYKNDWLEPLFGLSPAKVIADEGLNPAQPVSRGEALLLLDQLFGQKKQATSNQSQVPANTTPSMGSGMPSSRPSEQNINPGSQPANSLNRQYPQPIPLGHLQSVRESSPQGTRQALRVSGPE